MHIEIFYNIKIIVMNRCVKLNEMTHKSKKHQLDNENIYLSEEIFVKIFLYFDDITIFRCRCVCCRWYAILCDKTIKHYNIWNPIMECNDVKNYKDIFLESCQQKSILGIKYVSKLISQNIIYLTYSPHDLWNLGLIIGAENNYPELIRLMSKYGASNSKIEALSTAYKYNNILAINALMEEFDYIPCQLNLILNS